MNADDIVEPESPDGREWTAERLCRASYKDLGTPAEVKNRFFRHLLSLPSCRSNVRVLLHAESTTTRDYSMEVDAFELLRNDPVLGHLLLRFPATLMPLLQDAIVMAQKEIQREEQEQEAATPLGGNVLSSPPFVKGDSPGKGHAVTRVHARLVNLPPTCCRASIANTDSTDVGKIVQVTGTVVRTSPVQMYESARTYKCTGKSGCSRTSMQYADLEQITNALVKPERCPLYLEGGARCTGTNMQHLPDGSIHTDYQEIKIQERASKGGVGSIPRSLMIKLQHDLVDKCQPGDEVVVVGSLMAQWKQTLFPDMDCSVGMALNAHSIQVVQEQGSGAWDTSESGITIGESERFRAEFDQFWANPANIENPIAARDFICRAVCPKLYGLKIIKLSLLLTLIGGVPSSESDDCDMQTPAKSVHFHEEGTSAGYTIGNPEPFRIAQTRNSQNQALYYNGSQSRNTKNKPESVKTRRRDMSHMLLVGDPGTGKSQILRFAAALCPRSVLTTGVGTTSAGLTCAAVREGTSKEFALEAGALVLADKGVCCIDEFGCIRSEDRTTIHEAMEQQTLSVAKAGIVCKLNCRATIIAVMNPRDCLYDNQASLSANTGLGTPLLSRFDLIFKLVDTSDAERDSNVTTYLLNRAIQGAGFETSNTDGSQNELELPWSMEKLRAYISMVKVRFKPVISDDAALILEHHYEKIRSAQSTSIPVTVRFLESLIRLSQAHARLMYHDVVTLEDAVAVIRVMECTAFCYGGYDNNVDDIENVLYCDPMAMDCSSDPDGDFLIFEYRILDRYGMLNRLSDEQRQKAERIVAGMDQPGGFYSNQEWQHRENLRDRHTTVSEDHYGRHHYSQTPTKRKRK